MCRPITTLEAAIVERALQVASMTDVPADIIASIRSLQVTATCRCGCATVWFGPDGDASTGKIVSDARATAGDEDIDVIVWSDQGAIVGLELVGTGAVPLPDPSSVRGHDVA